MNAPHPLQAAMVPAAPPVNDDDDGIDLLEYWDIVVDNRWLVAVITALGIAAGAGYALLARPVYESNLLIQVEDSAGSAKNFLGEASSLFDVKTAAAAEIEILRSRMVIGRAVDNTSLVVDARPRYIPLVGNWLARHADGLSKPLAGYVSGREAIRVQTFDVPEHLEGKPFRLIAGDSGQYTLWHPDLQTALAGKVGTPLSASTPDGTVTLLVSNLEAKAGAEFNLTRRSRLRTIEELQSNIKLAEKGRDTGIIDARLQSGDPKQLTLVLNEIGREYVRQNIERKAEEARKMLSFLDAQLPQFKRQLDQSEEAYNRYRNKEGTVSLDEEAKLILRETVDLEGKLLDAQQKRRDLVSRFTTEHPAVRTLDDQIAAWRRQIETLNARVRGMPAVQQNALRLERDAKVNNEAYQSLRNNALQLQLIREGKTGNARLIDEATIPEGPIKPKGSLVIGVGTALGLLGGLMLALARNAFFRGIRNPQEIEAHTGLSVFSTIPLTPDQAALGQLAAEKRPGIHVLAERAPHDLAVESLRSLRTALQFAMLDAPNNRVLVTGPTPGVGKSFLSANFAAILGSAGKRVLLIDADLRKGHLNQYFGLARTNGLSEVVSGQIDVEQALHRDVLPNLDFLPTGVLPPNPAEISMSAGFLNLLNHVSPKYDIVIIDTPPVLVAADTVGIAAHAGTVLLVARAAQTQIGELHESAKRLAHAGKAVSGVLFNGLDLTRRHYGSYGYKYGQYRYRYYTYGAFSPDPQTPRHRVFGPRS